jgi:hypothetical protein
MDKPSSLALVVVVLALGIAFGSYRQSSASAQIKENPKGFEATKWDYRIVVVREAGGGPLGGGGGNEKTAERELSKLGEDGFEIAFVTSGQVTNSLTPRDGGGDSRPILYYTLRRTRK